MPYTIVYLLLPVARTRPALVTTIEASVPQHTDTGLCSDGNGTSWTLQ